MKTYKIRQFANGKNKAGQPFINYSLTIPSHVAEALPDDMTYACELTDEGILFKPAQSEAEQVVLPDWAKRQKAGNGNGSGAAKPRPRRKPAAA